MDKLVHPDLREARHALRGRVNALKLCVSALPACESPSDALEFLMHIDQACDALIDALDHYEQVHQTVTATP